MLDGEHAFSPIGIFAGDSFNPLYANQIFAVFQIVGISIKGLGDLGRFEDGHLLPIHCDREIFDWNRFFRNFADADVACLGKHYKYSGIGRKQIEYSGIPLATATEVARACHG